MIKREIEKLKSVGDVEKIRLRLEWFKAWGTFLAILVPLSIGAGTIAVSLKLATARERADFELKAAEIVMTADSPEAAANKAAVLVELFPDRLSRRFAETFTKLYGDVTSTPRR